MLKHIEEFHTDFPPSVTHSKVDGGPSTKYHLSNFVSYKNFSNSHKAFLAAITYDDEPKNFSQAVMDSIWRDAISKEIHALEEKNSSILIKLPVEKKTINSKWIYMIKYRTNGEMERSKAWLVAKGFT